MQSSRKRQLVCHPSSLMSSRKAIRKGRALLRTVCVRRDPPRSNPPPGGGDNILPHEARRSPAAWSSLPRCGMSNAGFTPAHLAHPLCKPLTNKAVDIRSKPTRTRRELPHGVHMLHTWPSPVIQGALTASRASSDHPIAGLIRDHTRADSHPRTPPRALLRKPLVHKRPQVPPV